MLVRDSANAKRVLHGGIELDIRDLPVALSWSVV
jgi:hypothetical protein